MFHQNVFAFFCLVAFVGGIPSWKSVKDMLHEKLEDIYNDRDEMHKNIEEGRYFHYYLADVGSFKAIEEGTNALPSWLSFDGEKKKLQGVPAQNDMRKGLNILFVRTDKKDAKTTKKLTLNIVQSKNSFGCKESVSIASVIFHADLKQLEGVSRVKFLREFSHHFEETSVSDLYLENGNRMDSGMLNSNVRIAGPGDKITGSQPGFTISWKLKCGLDIENHADIGVLRTYTQKEDFSEFHKPVVGWFISFSKANRNRREVGNGATPGVTPSIQGTPTLVVPSASIDVKATSINVKITPTKSMTMMKTSVVVPPVVTTEEPTTAETTTTTTTTSTKTTTEEITTQPTTEAPTTLMTKKPTVNRPPEVDQKHKFDLINAQEQHATIFEVPPSLFRDDDLIVISLLYKKDSYVDEVPNWIAYREDGRRIYLFPQNQQAGEHQFSLKAKDPGGLVAQHFFKVLVKKDQTVYDFQFNVTLDMNYDEIANDAVAKVKLVDTISKALDNSNSRRMKNVQFLKGSVIVRWGDSRFANSSSCNHPELNSYIRKLENNKFVEDLSPEYTVLSTGKTSASNCPMIVATPTVDPEESLWERILIPVIVIVIILLIIALILCCVYRRKKKYEPASNKDESYLNQKKPVIFLEEYEEKPDFVSLQPLILPNEKPPAQGYGPRGESPDAPESSTTASTESDENAPLAPKSPKENRSGYNAPPPYSAR